MFAVLVGAAALAMPADSLTLEAALAFARAHRGQAAVARALSDEARAKLRADLSIPEPLATYTYTGAPPRRHATVDQPLDWLVRRGSDAAAGRAGIAAARADSTQLLADIDRDTRSAFYAALGAARGLAIAEDGAQLADSLAAVAGRRRAAGDITELEAAQASLEAARAGQLVSLGRESRDVALAGLERAIGAPPGALPPLTGALDANLDGRSVEPREISGLAAVRRARAEAAAARAEFHAAEWARVPFPSVQFGREWDDPNVIGESPTTVVGLALPLPLWQTGRARAASARARAAAADARLREAEAEAVQLQAQSIVRLQEAGRRAIVARDSILPLARRQRELALLAYQAGDTGIVPVLDALRAERDVTRDLLASLVSYQSARADWLALIGESR